MRVEKRGDAGTPHKRGGAVTPCAFVEALPPLSEAAELHRSGANLPPQIYSAFIRCNTLYLAMQGVCHPFPLDSLKGCVGAEAIPIYCLCILATLRLISAQAHPQLVPYLPYRSRQHSRLWLECFPPQRTSVSVATASATSFLSSAVMYLWGQLSYIQRYCRRVFRVATSHFGSF